MPALKPLRELRPLRANFRKVVVLSLPPELVGHTAKLYAKTVDATADAIEADLAPWIRRSFRADAADYQGDLRRVLRAVEGRIPRRVVEAVLNGVAKAVDEVSFDKLARVPGIDPNRIIPGAPAELERFRRINAQLIQSIPERMALDVAAVLAEPGVRDLHVKEIGKILADRFNVAHARGEFWARDQTLKLYARLQEARQRAAGASSYQWETSVDERVRGRPGGMWARNASNHWVLHDTIQRWDLAPVTNPRTGARNHPGHDYQCRCSAYPIFDGNREPLPPPPPPETTPEEEAAELRGVGEQVAPFEPPRVQVQVPDPAREARRAALLAEAERIAAEEAKPFAGFAEASRVTGTTVADGRAVRESLRREIRRTLTVGTSNPVGELAVVPKDDLARFNAEALFYPSDRHVAFSDEILARANAAIRKLQGGRLSLDEETRHELDGLRIMVHEEIHSASGSPLALSNAQSRVVEEIGTELSARRVIRRLVPELSLADAGRSYSKEITLVRYALQKLTKQPPDVLLELMTKAHEKTALARTFATPEDAVDSWLEALGLTADQKTSMLNVLAAVQERM